MEIAILLAVLITIPCAWIIGTLVRKLSTQPQTLPVTAEWIDELSTDRYRPMLRLLKGDDIQYLTEREGYSRRQAHAFRAKRCEIVRGYLRWLDSDFARITMAIRVLMVQSQHDRPDLAVFLIRQKLAFHLGMIAIQLHLQVYRWGLTRVDASAVMSAFDSMRVELRQMVPAMSGAGA